MGLYYTKNSAAGQPILLDGFHFSTDPTTPEGYDTATEFCSVEPFNVKSYCDKTLYLHFKRDGECTTMMLQAAMSALLLRFISNYLIPVIQLLTHGVWNVCTSKVKLTTPTVSG